MSNKKQKPVKRYLGIPSFGSDLNWYDAQTFTEEELKREINDPNQIDDIDDYTFFEIGPKINLQVSVSLLVNGEEV